MSIEHRSSIAIKFMKRTERNYNEIRADVDLHGDLRRIIAWMRVLGSV